MSELWHEIVSEPPNVYAVAFGIFWLLAFIFARKPGMMWLDNEIGKITTELSKARDLRVEAEAALADVKTKQALAEKEARDIIDMARQQAEAMRKQSAEELAATLARHKQLAADRIHIAEIRAVDAIRAEAVKLGMEIARQTLSEDMSGADAVSLIERGIEDVSAFKR